MLLALVLIILAMLVPTILVILVPMMFVSIHVVIVVVTSNLNGKALVVSKFDPL